MFWFLKNRQILFCPKFVFFLNMDQNCFDQNFKILKIGPKLLWPKFFNFSKIDQHFRTKIYFGPKLLDQKFLGFGPKSQVLVKKKPMGWARKAKRKEVLITTMIGPWGPDRGFGPSGSKEASLSPFKNKKSREKNKKI